MAAGGRVDGSAVAEGVFDNGQGGEHLGQPGLAASDSGCLQQLVELSRRCSEDLLGAVAQGRHLDSAIVVAGLQRRQRVELGLFQDDIGRCRVGGDLFRGFGADDR